VGLSLSDKTPRKDPVTDTTHTRKRSPALSVEDFFSPPERAGATISPDGTRIAYLAPWRNRLNVWVQDVEGTGEPRCVTADETRSVYIYSWTHDSRWVQL